jgi:hypothetical protein
MGIIVNDLSTYYLLINLLITAVAFAAAGRWAPLDPCRIRRVVVLVAAAVAAIAGGWLYTLALIVLSVYFLYDYTSANWELRRKTPQ